jgi:hypothetical protein
MNRARTKTATSASMPQSERPSLHVSVLLATRPFVKIAARGIWASQQTSRSKLTPMPVIGAVRCARGGYMPGTLVAMGTARARTHTYTLAHTTDVRLRSCWQAPCSRLLRDLMALSARVSRFCARGECWVFSGHRDCCCVQPVCNRKHLHCKRYRRKLKNWRALTAASGSLVGAAASGGFVSGSLGFTGAQTRMCVFLFLARADRVAK